MKILALEGSYVRAKMGRITVFVAGRKKIGKVYHYNVLSQKNVIRGETSTLWLSENVITLDNSNKL